MMEYTSSNRIIGTLIQIKKAIKQLQDWNKDVQSVDDYYCTPEGMKNLAASCMLIEAIGEGVKQIDKLTQSRLLIERPEIPYVCCRGYSYCSWWYDFSRCRCSPWYG